MLRNVNTFRNGMSLKLPFEAHFPTCFFDFLHANSVPYSPSADIRQFFCRQHYDFDSRFRSYFIPSHRSYLGHKGASKPAWCPLFFSSLNTKLFFPLSTTERIILTILCPRLISWQSSLHSPTWTHFFLFSLTLETHIKSVKLPPIEKLQRTNRNWAKRSKSSSMIARSKNRSIYRKRIILVHRKWMGWDANFSLKAKIPFWTLGMLFVQFSLREKNVNLRDKPNLGRDPKIFVPLP